MESFKILSSEASLEIEAPDECCYHFCRNFEAFPTFLHNVKAVRHIRDNLWQWTLKGKGGEESNWELSLERDIPHKLISWRSVKSPDIEILIDVNFQPLHAHETLVSIDLSIYPPSLPMQELFKKTHGLTEEDLKQNLQVFKSRIEAQHYYEGSPTANSRGLSARE